MKLYAIRILVRDWEAACDFYGNKLGLKKKFGDESMGWAEFDVGGANLGIERAGDDTESQALVGRFLGVSLQVDDIQATYEKLSGNGVDFTGPPEKQPWGGSLAHFSDPDGNVLTLLG